MEGLCYQAFLRVLNSEDSVMRGGGAPLRVLILSKMASSMPLTDDSIIAFLDYISKDFEKRTDLVIQVIFLSFLRNIVYLEFLWAHVMASGFTQSG